MVPPIGFGIYELAQAISSIHDTSEDIHHAALDLLRLIPPSDSVITNKLLDKINNDLQNLK
jgi:translation elongation factor EF-1beta